MDASLKINIVKDIKGNLVKNIAFLNDYIQNRKLFLSEVKEKGGVYAFWWNGNVEMLKEALLTCDYKLKGGKSQKELISVKFTEEWIEELEKRGKICLYIGKSTNIKNRISKHLKLGTENIWEKPGEDEKVIDKNIGLKPNTVSQLRIGLERIFNYSIFDGIIDNIGVSWIVLDGYENSINRFYLEDSLIGEYFPLLNIDIER